MVSCCRGFRPSRRFTVPPPDPLPPQKTSEESTDGHRSEMTECRSNKDGKMAGGRGPGDGWPQTPSHPQNLRDEVTHNLLYEWSAGARARSANPSSRPSPLNELPVKETNPDQHSLLEKTVSPPDISVSLFQIWGWGLRFPRQFIKARLTRKVPDATGKCSPSLGTALLDTALGGGSGITLLHTPPAKQSQELPTPLAILYFLERKSGSCVSCFPQRAAVFRFWGLQHPTTLLLPRPLPYRPTSLQGWEASLQLVFQALCSSNVWSHRRKVQVERGHLLNHRVPSQDEAENHVSTP